MDLGLGASTIVYVEDDRLVFRATERMASALGLTMVGADSGAAARRVLKEVTPALILVDAALPDCDGVELATEFAAELGCPIVTVSGRKRPADARFFWLGKPFRRREFEAMLAEVVPELMPQ